MPFGHSTRKMVPGPVLSLRQMASQVVMAHLALLTDIGDMPYSLAEPFLSQCKAEQLAEIELASPHIKKDSRILWKRLTLQDFFEFRIAYEKGEIKEPSNWRRSYIAAHENRQIKEQERRQCLKDSYAALESQRQERKLVFSNKLSGDKIKKSRFSTATDTRSTSTSSILSKARSHTKSYAQNFRLPRSQTRPNSSGSTVESSRRTFPVPASSVIREPGRMLMSTRPINPAQRFVIDSTKPKVIDRRPVYVPPEPEPKLPSEKVVVNFFKKDSSGEIKKGGTGSVVKNIIRQKVTVSSPASSRTSGSPSAQSPPAIASSSPSFARARYSPVAPVYSPPAKANILPISPPSNPAPVIHPVSTTSATVIPAGQPSRPPKRKEVNLFIPTKRKKMTA
ncbi:RNA polymerase II transcription elongation factor Elongin/SIII, subunit elongin A [Phaffia rhodozyma]|uniref:RNA polymerase II transcription elongation factor Elongin/SIII, subunit elongin A n=1 Tax=Phaffia rhodozyma TaxID=264483 RepID=A0A0F7SHE4_PHARH|nr:RNA polymerase II transcription elongation factor Elongin/SIII, subunit elongin A [Phaffia rhodozyma]